MRHEPISIRWLLLGAVCFALSCDPANCGAVGGLPDGGGPEEEDAGGDPVPPPPPERCALPLDAWITTDGTGASARAIAVGEEPIGGPNAHARAGDFLLQNDRIRVVVQGKGRHIGANPYGGTIIDADLVRPAGEGGRDQFGEIGLLYNFGRTVDAQFFEILRDGSDGGSAIIAASGVDSENDYLSIRGQLESSFGTFVVDPYVPVTLKITNYFILNPGESRVRYVTAFCNTGTDEVRLAVGDFTDPGYTVELFNGQSCTGGFGSGGLCFGLDRMSWYAYQGDGVAYGYAPWRPVAPSWPEPQNAMLTVSGISGSILGAPGLQGLLDWFNPEKPTRGGELRVQRGFPRAVLRDFIVARDVGEIASLVYRTRSEVTQADVGTVRGTVTAGASPVANARVTLRDADEIVAVYVTDANGEFGGTVPVGSYSLSAWAPGRAPTPEQSISVASEQQTTATLTLGGSRALTVKVRDAANGNPLPAKVTVLCTGNCPATATALNLFGDTLRDPLLDGIQHVGFVPFSGEATFQLPPGQYHVVVTRGPEYSIFPNTWPSSPGALVDLRTQNGTVEAKLARVVDTTGFMSADFHVHAVNSPDSALDNETRVLSFAAEGVDILVSTDHDYVTDFAPAAKAIGAEDLVATVIGEEVSTMDFGHYNLFPMNHDPTNRINGGAVDWAGGAGPTLTVAELFAEARKHGAKVIHFNHPRGFLGGLTHLQADLDTLATHADPAKFRMATPAGANPEDTKILSDAFNAMEILNSGEDAFKWSEMYPKFNDWFTLLSRGLRITGTGVSDTHYRNALSGGYWRTWVKLGVDAPADFSPDAMATALNAQKAIASNGPFVDVRVVRVNASGAETSLPAGLGDTLAASTDKVKVTVDIQVPEYLDVTRVELYMHTPADDARCPVDPASAIAKTTRVACNGQPNKNWPVQSIAATQSITLGSGDLQPVLTADGVTYKRWRKQVTFTLPAPSTDNWIVAFVYGSKPLFPLVFDKLKPGSAVSPALPFALTNPVFVDADGNGYDRPPFNPNAMRKLQNTPAERQPPGEAQRIHAPRPLTVDEALEAWEPYSHFH